MGHDNRTLSHKITCMTFFLALGVMLAHAYNLPSYNVQEGSSVWLFEKLFHDCTYVMVPVFYVLSGYLFFRNFEYSKLLEKWKTRFFSLVIPFFVWNLLAYFWFQILTLVPVLRDYLPWEREPFSVLTLMKAAVMQLGPFWYLRQLIPFLIVFPILYGILRKKLICALMTGLFFIMGSVCYEYHSPIVNAAYFLFGVFIGIHYRELPYREFGRKYRIVSLIGFFLISTLVTLMGKCIVHLIPLCRFLQIAMLWIGMDGLAKDKCPKWWMCTSFFIYCAHPLILGCVEKGFFWIFGNNPVGALLDFIGAPVVSFLIILVIYRLIGYLPEPVVSALTGGRYVKPCEGGDCSEGERKV